MPKSKPIPALDRDDQVAFVALQKVFASASRDPAYAQALSIASNRGDAGAVGAAFRAAGVEETIKVTIGAGGVCVTAGRIRICLKISVVVNPA